MHIDDGDLALLALGEGGASDQAHLKSCSVCRAEVESLASVNDVMSQGGPMPVEAPAHLWPAIEAAIAQAAPVSSATAGKSTAGNVPAVTASVEEDRPRLAATHPVDLGSRREHQEAARSASRRFYGVSLLSAAAVGAGIMWLGASLLNDQEQPTDIVATQQPTDPAGDEGSPSVVASADLAALEDSVDPATAQIIERDGQRVLRVEADSLPAVEDGYLQVWLLEDDVVGMVTVGALTASDEEFLLPEGLSTDTFTTVDVSVEHYDGNPEHSGESLWRGAITST